MNFYKTQLVACEDLSKHRKTRVLIPVTIFEIKGAVATVSYKDLSGQFYCAEVYLQDLLPFNRSERKLNKGDTVYAPWTNDDKTIAYQLYRAVVLRDQGSSDVIKVKFDGDKLERFCSSNWVVFEK